MTKPYTEKIKILLFYTLIHLMISSTIEAQAPVWKWGKGGNNFVTAESQCITCDEQGNIYVAGNFSSVQLTLGNITLQNWDMEDLFIAKYDQEGNILWAKQMGDDGDEFAYGIATDKNGNVYVTGSYTSPFIELDNIRLENTPLKDNEGNDEYWENMFLIKYDKNGNLLWARNGSGEYSVMGKSVTVDKDGKITVAGDYDSPTATFEGHVLTNTNKEILTSDIFMVQYDRDGNLLWAKNQGGTGTDWPNAIATDTKGNIYMAGCFRSDLLNIGNATLTNAKVGTTDFFIAKYNNQGEADWAKSSGGTEHDWASSVTTDQNDNVYVGGFYRSSSVIMDEQTINNDSHNDFFIAKILSNGQTQWIRNHGGLDADVSLNIASDKQGNVYATGHFESNYFKLGNTILTQKGEGDVFVVNYDTNGKIKWLTGAGETGYDKANGVIADNNGNAYIAGKFESPTIRFGDSTLQKNGNIGIFTAKIGFTTTSQKHPTVTPGVNCFPNPSQGVVTISSADRQLQKVEIFNMAGAQILNKETSESTLKLDLSNNQNGVYFLRITTNKGVTTTKVTLKK